ncbi:MAG TPA: hypothetical protein VJZ03_05275 [Candidatus Bathyarchaeia archaeon]|nr:hypothetical protein [Candidatus Bathyarchaeia archaeon]
MPKKRRPQNWSRTKHNPKFSVWKRRYEKLTPQLRLLRKRSLEVVSLVRREKLSPRKAAKQVGLPLETVVANTNAFHKKRGRLTVKKFDRISRVMIIYEKGRKVPVEVASSQTASTISEYHNAVKQFLDTGKSSFLKEFRKTRFKDIKGHRHTLETNPRTIYRLAAQEPTPEFFQIYHQ